MSQHNKSSWVAATLTSLIMTVAALATIPAAHAAPGDPIIPATPSCVVQLVSGDPATAPPAPTCYDPSGSDLDEFVVPQNAVNSSGHGVGYVDGNMNQYHPVNSTNGASQVFIQATSYNPATGTTNNDYSWTLTFSQSVTGTEAGESYRAEVIPGTCNSTTSQWQVNWLVYNKPDVTQRYIPVIDGSVYRLADDDTTIPPGMIDEFLRVERVHDGRESSLGIESMYPGTYKFAATKGSVTSGWQSWRLEVPSCGRYRGPDAADAPGTGTTTGSLTGKFRQLSPTKMKAIVNGRRVDYSVKVKIVIDPKVGKTVIKAFTMKPRSVLRKTFRAAPGTKFVMKVRVRLVDADGRYSLKWKVLKRATLRRG